MNHIRFCPWNRLLPAIVPILALSQSVAAAYLDHAALTARLRKLANDQPGLVRLESLSQSLGKREVWRLELGTPITPPNTNRPAMLVVAGLEGNDLVGSSVALGWAEGLIASAATNATIKQLLKNSTIHVIPRLNVDATESFFASPKVDRIATNLPVDDDHDGLIDEDAAEDLNTDGVVTQMRVQDPEGEFVLDATEPRLLVKADKAKGERGAWRLLTEGIDNDKDEAWNEDGLGGVNLNRNFPFGYKFFDAASGKHPVSEVETRALADFFVSHANIGIVFTFGAADVLTQTPKAEPGGKRPPGAMHEGDLPILKELGKSWRDALGLKKEVSVPNETGTFAEWAYFDRGRLAVSTRAWSPALQVELTKARQEQEKAGKDDKGGKDEKTGDKPPPNSGRTPEKAEKGEKPDKAEPQDSTNAAEKAPSSDSQPASGRQRRGGRGGDAAKPDAGKPSSEARTEEDRAWLKWVDENSPGAFVQWKEFAHPDFPGKKVEIGGHAPFARSNPPEKFLDDLIEREGKFLTELAGKAPRIAFRKAEAKSLGESVFELVIQVENNGYLPTMLAQGSVTSEVHPTRLLLNLDEKAFLSGAPRTMLGVMEGSGGMVETRFVVRAKGLKEIKIEAISMLAGTIQTTVQLKEGQ